ncbi:MAG: 50S ribosomal protein L6 [Patescibacteria group bacterium]
MSRIGKQPIPVPDGVDVKISGGDIVVKGSKGELHLFVPREIAVVQSDKTITISLAHETKDSRKLWGTIRSLIAGMIIGVTSGFEKKLELEGVGYKVALVGRDLELALGFSHPVRVEAPKDITFKVEKNAITVSGVSKELVGRIAANIRALKKPEPYKGKGIHYVGEVIRRKAGKKATTS